MWIRWCYVAREEVHHAAGAAARTNEVTRELQTAAIRSEQQAAPNTAATAVRLPRASSLQPASASAAATAHGTDVRMSAAAEKQPACHSPRNKRENVCDQQQQASTAHGTNVRMSVDSEVEPSHEVANYDH